MFAPRSGKGPHGGIERSLVFLVCPPPGCRLSSDTMLMTSRRIVLTTVLLVVGVLGAPPAQIPPVSAQTDDHGDDDPFTINPVLMEQAERAADLGEFVNDTPAAQVIPPGLRTRRALLAERARLQQAGDAAGVARYNSVLASEGFERAARLTAHWLDRRDQRTGLFPHTLRPDGRVWTYGDAGSDLFPFLGTATRYLLPTRYD